MDSAGPDEVVTAWCDIIDGGAVRQVVVVVHAEEPGSRLYEDDFRKMTDLATPAKRVIVVRTRLDDDTIDFDDGDDEIFIDLVNDAVTSVSNPQSCCQKFVNSLGGRGENRASDPSEICDLDCCETCDLDSCCHCCCVCDGANDMGQSSSSDRRNSNCGFVCECGEDCVVL